MKEYTILSIISVVFTVLLDKLLGVNLFKNKRFILFLFVIFLFKLVVNGFLTSKNIVIYNPKYYLGWRFTSIPVEDFLFGFSMVTVCIIFWQILKEK